MCDIEAAFTDTNGRCVGEDAVKRLCEEVFLTPWQRAWRGRLISRDEPA